MVKKLFGDTLKLGGVSIGLGVGSAIAARAGGHASPAFATAGRMMGPVTIGVMGGNTLRILRKNIKTKY